VSNHVWVVTLVLMSGLRPSAIWKWLPATKISGLKPLRVWLLLCRYEDIGATPIGYAAALLLRRYRGYCPYCLHYFFILTYGWLNGIEFITPRNSSAILQRVFPNCVWSFAVIYISLFGSIKGRCPAILIARGIA